MSERHSPCALLDDAGVVAADDAATVVEDDAELLFDEVVQPASIAPMPSAANENDVLCLMITDLFEMVRTAMPSTVVRGGDALTDAMRLARRLA